MKTKVQKNQYFLFISQDAGLTYDTVVCLLNFNFSGTTATSDASSMCGPDSAAGDISSTIQLNAQYMINPDSGEIVGGQCFDLWQNSTAFRWKIGRAVPEYGDYTKQGDGYFSAYQEGHSKDGVSTFSGTITVQGTVTQTFETGS